MLDLETILLALHPCPVGLALFREVKARHPGVSFAEFWRLMCLTRKGRAACSWAVYIAWQRTRTSAFSGDDFPDSRQPPVESVDLIAVQRGLAKRAADWTRDTTLQRQICQALQTWNPA